MTLKVVRSLMISAGVLTAAALVPVGTGAAAPSTLRAEPTPQVRLADWYGTAQAIALGPTSGAYYVTRDAGSRPVVLEERSVRVRVITAAGQKAPVRRATGWHRLATAPPTGLPAVGQWTRSAGYNGKQFRLCRLGVPGKGKVCTAYSGVIVAL